MAHLEIVTPPASEPVTLAEAKLHLRLEITDDDALVTALITAARMQAEARLRMTLIQTVYDYFLDQFPYSGGGYFNRLIRQMGPGPSWLPTSSDAIIRLPNPPLVSVGSVQYYDPTGALTTISPSAYIVSTGQGSRIQPQPGNVWPVTYQRIDAVVIRMTCGVASAALAPEPVKAAMKLMIGTWYEHREEVADAATYPVSNTVDALLASTDPGIYS